jgi:outer membrane biosynthesis protein TonB
MALDERHRKEHRSYSRAVRVGLVASVVGHALLFLIFGGQRLPPSPFAAAGERQRDVRAAAGGGLEAVELRPPELAMVEAVPVPVPAEELAEEEVPEPEPEVEEVVAVALGQAVDLAGPPGEGEERGLDDGVGEGDGGTQSEGLFRVVPPRPRGLTLPPGDRPSDVRGKEIEVWVYVSAAGRVVPDSTRLSPPSGDRRFDRRLRDHAAAWVFEAASRDGRPVAEWFRYTIIM